MTDEFSIEERVEEIKVLNLSREELIERLARSEDIASFFEGVVDQQKALLTQYEGIMEELKRVFLSQRANFDEVVQLQELEIKSASLGRFLEGCLDGRAKEKKIRARQAAEARHEKAGGSRDKQRLIRGIWASGKYSSRDLCAEQECAALGMSFSSARKALRNTEDPVVAGKG